MLSYYRWKPGRGGRVHWAVVPGAPPDSVVAAGAARPPPHAPGDTWALPAAVESRVPYSSDETYPGGQLTPCVSAFNSSSHSLAFILLLQPVCYKETLEVGTCPVCSVVKADTSWFSELWFYPECPFDAFAMRTSPVSLAGFLLLMCCLSIWLLSAGAGCKAVLSFFF